MLLLWGWHSQSAYLDLHGLEGPRYRTFPSQNTPRKSLGINLVIKYQETISQFLHVVTPLFLHDGRWYLPVIMPLHRKYRLDHHRHPGLRTVHVKMANQFSWIVPAIFLVIQNIGLYHMYVGVL
jgi:hypothetical protein